MSKLSKVEQVVNVEEYPKGQALLILNPEAEGNRRFSFGIKKAKMIIEQFELIKRFVETFPEGKYYEL